MPGVLRLDEGNRSGYHRVWLVAVRRVRTVRQLQQPGVRHALGNAPDLRQSAVLVVTALDGQHGCADLGHLGLDIPRAKGRVQPDTVPAPEGGIPIVVIAPSLWRRSVCS